MNCLVGLSDKFKSLSEQGNQHGLPEIHLCVSIGPFRRDREGSAAGQRSEALIPVADGEKDAARSSTFVQQLELIDADDEQQLDAIADFIRCNIERSRLTAQGDITPSDWESFDTNIHKFWKNKQRRVLKFANPDTEAVETKLGNYTYTDCRNYRETLAGEPTQEYYLTRGTLHRQSDAEQLGWHPRYQELLRKPR